MKVCKRANLSASVRSFLCKIMYDCRFGWFGDNRNLFFIFDPLPPDMATLSPENSRRQEIARVHLAFRDYLKD